MAARREADLAFGRLHKRLMEDLGLRQLHAKGRQVPRQFMTVYEFEEAFWPVMQALEDPGLNRRVAEAVSNRLADIIGRRRLEFLKTLAEAPRPAATIAEMTQRLLQNPALEEGLEALHDAPIDGMYQTRDPGPVAEILSRLEEVRRLLRAG